MKIVEFGEDGSPRLLKQGASAEAKDTVVTVTREPPAPISDMSAGMGGARVEIDKARIKIREFGDDVGDEPARQSATKPAGTFGAARAPTSIRIVDFDKDKGKAQVRSTTHERPRGMKIIETE